MHRIFLALAGLTLLAAQDTPNLDPVRVDPAHYKIELDNDQVRVLRVIIPPGETAPMHEHHLNRVVTFIRDQNVRVTNPNGKSEIARHKAGEVVWVAGRSRHIEQNLGPGPFEVVVVELKH